MHLDPTQFTVKQARQMGMWPSSDLMAVAIAPYAKRMKGEVSVLDIGVGKGENIVYLAENVPNIRTIYGLSHNGDYESILIENIKDIGNIQRVYDGSEVDIVLVSVLPETDAELLEKYYSKVKAGGLFVGDNHDQVYTKEALSRFRRNAKIGTPIQIINRTTWFWKK